MIKHGRAHDDCDEDPEERVPPDDNSEAHQVPVRDAATEELAMMVYLLYTDLAVDTVFDQTIGQGLFI